MITDSGERDDKTAKPVKGAKGSSLFDKIKVKMPSKAKK